MDLDYVGSAYKQTMAKRNASHKAQLGKVQEAAKQGDHAMLNKHMCFHRGLYKPRLVKSVHLVSSWAGPTGDEEKSAEWLVENVPPNATGGWGLRGCERSVAREIKPMPTSTRYSSHTWNTSGAAS